MVTRRQRPCLDCGTLTRNPSRCDVHQAAWQARQNQQRGSATQRGYDAEWRRNSKAAVDTHLSRFGEWCPGYQIPPHPSQDLTGDHIRPLAFGGTNDLANIQVLCRGCNSRKHSRR